jgi:hypothetical protein
MDTKNLSEISNEDLLKKIKEANNGKIINAFIIGLTIGVFVFSVIKNGFGIFTFFPLAIGYLVYKNSQTSKVLEAELQKEMKSRNLHNGS